MRRRATLPRSRTDINDPPESGIGRVGRQRERGRAARSQGSIFHPDIFHFVNQPKIEEPDPRILGQVRKASTTQASDEQD